MATSSNDTGGEVPTASAVPHAPPPSGGDAAPAPQPPPAAPPAALRYETSPRVRGAVIDAADDGVSIWIRYRHERAWGLIIGFGLFAALLTALIVSGASFGASPGGRLIAVVGAVFCALLSIAAALPAETPSLHLLADERGLRMSGGEADQTEQWRREEVVAITAEALHRPPALPHSICVLIELSGDEFVVVPVATREEQAAVIDALAHALKLPLPPRQKPHTI